MLEKSFLNSCNKKLKINLFKKNFLYINMFPKILLKKSNKKVDKSRPLTPRTVKAINTYVKSLHVREKYNSKYYK